MGFAFTRSQRGGEGGATINKALLARFGTTIHRDDSVVDYGRDHPITRCPEHPMSKVFSQLGEPLHSQQRAPIRRIVHGLMLQHPGHVMRDEDGIDPRRQRRIDI